MFVTTHVVFNFSNLRNFFPKPKQHPKSLIKSRFYSSIMDLHSQILTLPHSPFCFSFDSLSLALIRDCCRKHNNTTKQSPTRPGHHRASSLFLAGTMTLPPCVRSYPREPEPYRTSWNLIGAFALFSDVRFSPHF